MVPKLMQPNELLGRHTRVKLEELDVPRAQVVDTQALPKVVAKHFAASLANRQGSS